MQVQFIDNQQHEMATFLASAIEASEEIKIAVAFVSRAGLGLLEDSISNALSKGATAEFLIGMDMHATEPKALHQLYEMTIQLSSVKLYCSASLRRGAIYHPKMYLLKQGSASTIVIGSSNLTRGGLKSNVEVNVALSGSETDEAISDAYGTYSLLKLKSDKIAPDVELLGLYEDLWNVTRKEDHLTARGPRKELIDRFEAKARTLTAPVPTRADLRGWMELVYDTLPNGEFTNAQAYMYKDIFATRFPRNFYIKEKIRQQLQYLAKLDFLEHVGRGRWRKR